MIDSTDTIRLNNQVYLKDNLNVFLQQSPAPALWQQAIYHFLQNWFDDTDYIISHTSGSTGKPKEIRLSKQAMENSARMTNAFFGLDATKTALLCLPASYIAGKMMLVRAIVGGFNLMAVEPKANPFARLSEPLDFAAITPYQLHHSAETLKEVLVKNIIVGGGPVNSQLEALAQNIPASMYETYGMTETCSHIALRCFNGEKKSEFFTVLEGVAIRQDERGCLVIKAPHLLDEEIQTNDVVELIGGNAFCWLGRADSVINTGGVKVHPEKVEKKLEGLLPHDYFIASVPDNQLGSKVVLVIEAEKFSKEQLDVLKADLAEKLHRFEIPKEIYFIPSFIRSEGNKVLRSEIMSQFIMHHS